MTVSIFDYPKIQENGNALAEDEELEAEDWEVFLWSGKWALCMGTWWTDLIGQVILHETWIVIPKVLRKSVLELSHEGYLGIVKMTERLSSKVCWPGVDKDGEQ